MPSVTRTRRTKKPPAPDAFDPMSLYHALRGRYGPSGWWPGESPIEIAVGAVLTQNTAWINVEKAIDNLKAAALLDLRKLHEADAESLASLIRPSGYYNIKAGRLKNLLHALMTASSGDMDTFIGMDLKSMRSLLLEVNGIGKETADSICCYAAEKTIFVVDAYTRRILSRHGIIDDKTDYDHIQKLFEEGIPRDLQIYKDLHAYIVFVGKEYCRPRDPRCDSCPLSAWTGKAAG